MKEWRLAASGGLNTDDYPYGIKGKNARMPNSIACFVDPSKTIPEGGSKEFSASMKNELGIYNMVGDVAELVSDTNLVLGGSYLSPLSECKVLSTKPYLKPEQDIGFRVVAEIVAND
jgi:formylglycine-generating enzyme required for sulfatase activity